MNICSLSIPALNIVCSSLFPGNALAKLSSLIACSTLPLLMHDTRLTPSSQSNQAFCLASVCSA